MLTDDEVERMILAKGLTAPRINPARVDAVLGVTADSSQFVNATFTKLPSGKVMVCEITLRNGYTVRGESAVVSPENFNEEIGKTISYANARHKVWGLEGYLLQESLYAARGGES